jgi:hypothetical protein
LVSRIIAIFANESIEDNMKRLLISVILTVGMMALSHAEPMTMSVSNPTAAQRHELILDELYRNLRWISFHCDYDKGLDCYAVGPTLGCGTPALLKDGKIQYPWCYERYRIIENGPLRFMLQLDFATTADGTTEHRILTLDRGSNFCEATVWYDGIKTPTDMAAGFAIREMGAATVATGDGYIQYADPAIDPEKHQCQIYVALLFPDTKVDITKMENHAGHQKAI